MGNKNMEGPDAIRNVELDIRQQHSTHSASHVRVFSLLHQVSNDAIKSLHMRKRQFRKKVTSIQDRTGDLWGSSMIVFSELTWHYW